MKDNTVFSQGIKTGLTAVGASVVLVLLAYLTGINMISWTFQGISYVVMIAVMIAGLLAFRKANGGYMVFAQGILIVLVAGLVSSVLSYFFNLLYYNVINPSAVEEIIEYSKSAVEKMGVALSDELEEQLRVNAEKNTHFSVLNLVFGVIGSLMIWSVLGAILGAIFSKKDPNNY